MHTEREHTEREKEEQLYDPSLSLAPTHTGVLGERKAQRAPLHTYIHTQAYTHTHTHTHTYIQTYTHINTPVNCEKLDYLVSTRVEVCVNECVRGDERKGNAFECVDACVCVRTYVRMCVHVKVFMHSLATRRTVAAVDTFSESDALESTKTQRIF